MTEPARAGRDRVVDPRRETQPFTIHVTRADGVQERLTVRAVIEASGTYTTPNPLSADGYPATGERTLAAAGRVTYRMPDVNDPAIRE